MSWAHYILQVNIYLIVFYGFYKFLLDKETYFNLNRLYLMSAGLLSVALPFLRFEWFIGQPLAHPVYSRVSQMNDYISVAIIQENVSRITLGNTLAFLYFAGVLFFLVRLVVQLISVRTLLRKRDKGFAFSFFGKKVIDVSLPEFRTINSHEDIHVRQLHSLDVIFFELLGIITWFNPIIYFYKHSIRNIHEYLADEEAAKFQGDKEQYALLLLSSAFGVTPSNLTNSFFNKSLIKKRIYMLHKQRSKKTAVLKYGLFLPLFAVALVMSSATIRKNEKILAVAEKLPLAEPLIIIKEAVSEISEAPSIKAPSNLPTAVSDTGGKHDLVITGQLPETTSKKNDPADIRVYDFVSLETQPTFPGGMEKFYTYLKENLRYPADAKANKLEGKVFLSFVVEKDGSLMDIKVDRKLGLGTDEEAVRVLKDSPKWQPGTQNGNVVRVKYNIPISFNLGTFAATSDADKSTPTLKLSFVASPTQEDKVYDFVSLEQQPTFPGGMAKFYEFLKKTVRYPAEAQQKNVQGKVFLSFVVEKNGELTNFKVDRKLGSGTDEEAIRVMKLSPNWIPGIQDNKAVRVKYNIPLSFTLSK